MTPLPAWVRPGQVIIERHRHAQERLIVGVYDWGVVTTGVESGRRTRISVHNLYRYRPVER